MNIYSTFSVVAIDPNTGELGSGAASCALSVGAAVPYFGSRSVVHSQHHASAPLAMDILSKIDEGNHPSKGLNSVLEEDSAREKRQLLCIDADGCGAAFSGAECESESHHLIGDNCVVAGNTLANKDVVNAMLEAFKINCGKKLSSRLLSTLVAGQIVGGDKRGKQSASIRVINPQDNDRWYMYPNLRVDDHPDPLEELRRLHEVFVKKKNNWR